MLAKNAKEIFLRPDLSRAEKVVYFALSTFSDKKNTCFPSHDNIAKRAAYSVSTVKRALMRLRELGLVAWKHCFDRDKSRLKNMYTIAEPNAKIINKESTPIYISRVTMPFYENLINVAQHVSHVAKTFFTPHYGSSAMEF